MKNEMIPIRLSHLLGHSGVGAIVRGPNSLVVVRDTREWLARDGEPGGRRIPYVERIRYALVIDQELREPPVASESAPGKVEGVCVPVTRFPRWARCPNPTCNALHYRPWSNANEEEARCNRCKAHPILDQVTWVLVDPAGYLADVPWRAMAHHREHGNCQVRDRLRLKEEGAERWLICDACKVRQRFRGDERIPFKVNSRMQPWTVRESVPARDPNENQSSELAHIVAINDARVYAPIAEVALVIPPESRVRKGTAVDRLYRNSEDRKKIDNARTPLAKKGALREIASRYRCTIKDIEAALADLEGGYPLYGASFTPGLMRESEYSAFLETLPDQQPDEDLVTTVLTSAWCEIGSTKGMDETAKRLVRGVDQLVRIDRLKAVKVFKGFKRPVQTSEQPITPPDIVGQSDWLPAVELFGEGIFITLDEDRLARWEQHPAVALRLEKLESRFARSGRDQPTSLSARFLLLHTLSHLLMRQIETEGGYPAASLSEIVYCATATKPKPMAGILIYVAVPDIAGSLGGLAELAEPRRFLGILTRAIEHGRWCSLDPVCSEHEGQGPGLLNLAACHACALVPDTSCEYSNTLLDRGFVKGTDNGLPDFFSMR